MHHLILTLSFHISSCFRVAYFLYSVAVRPQVKESNPEATFGGIAKIISAQFKALDAEERATWDAKAVADKERYQQEMAGKFVYRCS
jgi:hypothetical protein